MRSFTEIYELACLQKGGASEVEKQLPKYLNTDQLKMISNADFLSTMCRRIFRAGLKHSLVDAKWPNFEKVFNHFDTMFCAMLSDEDIEQHMQNTSLIRHLGKMRAIRTNAQFIYEVSQEHGNFGNYLAQWPTKNTIDLWLELKKQGAHLGGSSAPQFLRMVGKDTFIFTQDVVAVLKLEKVIEQMPVSQRDMRKAGDAMLIWHEESNRPLCEISRIVSFAAL